MITMKEIAKEAGVSQPAVSLVLNGRGQSSRICDATRERILATAQRLGYYRNEVARSMKTGRTNIIGIIGSLDSGYSMEIIKGISEAASADGYTLKLLPANDTESIVSVCRQCLEQRLDGIIVRSITESGMEIMMQELSPYQMPMMFVGNIQTKQTHLHVGTDDSNGVLQAVDHLISLGHRRIIFFDNILLEHSICSRRQGFLDGMRKHGLKGEHQVREIPFENFGRLQEIKTTLQERKPTAVVCVCDFTAMRVLQAAAALGMRVPEDLSVVGFGNLDFAEYANPPLTTVAQPFVAMGRKAAELLIAKIAGGDVPAESVLPVTLVLRQSTMSLNINH